MKYDVFISYRREGGSEKAELVKTVLLGRGYRKDRIFMDTHSLSVGNYKLDIDKALSSSLNCIVVITKDCFNNLDSNGTWVHEISTAMSLGINIVPVYFDGIDSLDKQSLPDSIKDFPDTNAVQYVHTYAEASFDRMCSFLKIERKPLLSNKALKWAAGGVTGGAAAIGVTLAALSGNGDSQKVYVVDSPTSKRYHVDKDCMGLSNASHKVKTVTLDEAIEMGKTPCGICTKKDNQ